MGILHWEHMQRKGFHLGEVMFRSDDIRSSF